MKLRQGIDLCSFISTEVALKYNCAADIAQWNDVTDEGNAHVKIGTPREILNGENRVAMTPDSATQLQKLGYECLVETGAGAKAGFSDDLYREAGVTVVDSAEALVEALPRALAEPGPQLIEMIIA